MNNFLLRGLLSATVCLVAGSAFAQTPETATIGVSNDVTLRKDADGKNVDNAFPTKPDLELWTSRDNDKAITTDFVALMSFDIPTKPGYAVKSATLRLVTERAKGTMAIYAFGAEISNKDTYNSQLDNVTAARKSDPLLIVKLRGTENKSVTDAGASSNLEDWVNDIDLTSYVKTNGTGKLNLLFANAAESTKTAIKVFSSDAADKTNTNVTPNFTFKAEDLRPQLTVVYEEIKDAKQDVSLPTADTYVRKGYKNRDLGVKDVMELNSNTEGTADFVGLLSFALPEELHYSNYVASNANLRLVTRGLGKGGNNVNVFKFSGAFDEKSLYSDLEADIKDARSTSVLASFLAKGQKNKAISDKGLSADYTKIENWVNNINLTDVVNSMLDSQLNLMIESADKDGLSTKIFSKDVKDVTCQTTNEVLSANDLKPQLTVDYALATHTLSVTEAGAATLVLPYETEIPEGVKAYTLAYASGNKAVATELTGVIPANTPVLVNAEKGDYTFKATATLTTKAAEPVRGSLHGVWSEEVVPVGSYVLQNQSGTVAFYRVDAEGFKVKANQAYLHATDAAGAKMLNIDFGGEATAINGVEAEASNANTQVYTIDGKKANRNNLAKGQVYVTKGKTFILK